MSDEKWIAARDAASFDRNQQHDKNGPTGFAKPIDEHLWKEGADFGRQYERDTLTAELEKVKGENEQRQEENAKLTAAYQSLLEQAEKMERALEEMDDSECDPSCSCTCSIRAETALEQFRAFKKKAGKDE